LANIKQQIRRNRRTITQQERNVRYRSTMKRLYRRVDEALEAGNQEEADARSLELERLLDRAADKGVVHKNTAARRKQRLARRRAAGSSG
jgi:small subunit ribosomal protein S20